MRILNLSSDDDKILLSRTLDSIRFCEEKKEPHFLGFLNLRQRQVIEDYAKKHISIPYLFWGGYVESERTMIGLFPSSMEPDALRFKVKRLDFLFRPVDKLTHRDFLGSLISSGIKREMVGDILVAEGKCCVFLSEEIAGYVSTSLTRVGKVGITYVREQNWQIPFAHCYALISNTIASPRLDCVISSLLNVSRAQSEFFVNIGKINVNFSTVCNLDFQIKQDDIISVKNYGRYTIEQIGPLTKKGRLSFKAKRII